MQGPQGWATLYPGGHTLGPHPPQPQPHRRPCGMGHHQSHRLRGHLPELRAVGGRVSKVAAASAVSSSAVACGAGAACVACGVAAACVACGAGAACVVVRLRGTDDSEQATGSHGISTVFCVPSQISQIRTHP